MKPHVMMGDTQHKDSVIMCDAGRGKRHEFNDLVATLFVHGRRKEAPYNASGYPQCKLSVCIQD